MIVVVVGGAGDAGAGVAAAAGDACWWSDQAVVVMRWVWWLLGCLAVLGRCWCRNCGVVVFCTLARRLTVTVPTVTALTTS